MNDVLAVFQFIIDVMKLQITVYDYTFSLWNLLLFMAVGLLLIGFVRGMMK